MYVRIIYHVCHRLQTRQQCAACDDDNPAHTAERTASLLSRYYVLWYVHSPSLLHILGLTVVGGGFRRSRGGLHVRLI
ncbi:hypothetical protein K504DRAFT_157078 [Pleomassaria siparia CBS 279.74]|uniref:Uncharacterized protein n=1 Tax=Pleomassaria siparia CBS 279.74 TaxID=1314801 RepID=A0A6G1KN21_9PLEO|nr:hypothetical protein K504DRAFT_157078 [Pleomassaria siparia CBS 279.74]